MTATRRLVLLVQLPIDPNLARLCDEGNIERYDAQVVDSLGKAVVESVAAKAGKSE